MAQPLNPPARPPPPGVERAPLGSGPRRAAPAPGGKRRPPPRHGGLLAGAAYFFLFVLVAGMAGVAYLFLNPPSQLIRQKIAEQVKERTGRDLVISGPASFMFFPVLGVSLGGVALSGPPGVDGKLVRMQSLDVSVKALTVFSRHVEISAVVLKKPVFDLRVDKTGRNNWDFASRGLSGEPGTRFAELQASGSRRDSEPIAVAAADDGSKSGKTAAISNLQLDDVRIEDGVFRFTDDRTGQVAEVGAVNVKLELPSLSSPLSASGSFAWRDNRLNFEGKLADVSRIFDEKSTQLTFKAYNSLINASYDGGVLVKDGVYLEGEVAAKSDSARDLAHWFGTVLPPVSGFGPLSIKGTLKTRGNITDFSSAKFGLDGATADGTITVTTGGVRPYVDATLAVSTLDLNKYLTSAVTGVVATDGASAPDAASAPALKPSTTENSPGQGDEIEKLLQGSKVYGAVQRAGWSSEKLNLTLLGVADGDVRLTVGKLMFKNLTVGQSSVAVAVKDRAMKAKFEDIALYQGHGRGTVSVDGSADTANVGANFALDGVSALPFLKDAANFEWIAGNANVQLQLAANGASQLQLVESLNGKAAFKFSEGAIVGFNLPGAIRGISNGDLSGLRKAPSEKTDFSALGATFAIANGVAQNQDLQLVSPLLRVTGAGTIHMPERTVDYTVKPKLVASLEGQQGESDESGIEVPVRISGSWDAPKYQADLKSMLSDPNKTVETIKELGKKFKGKSAGEIVNQLFGKKKEGDGTTASTSDGNQNAKDLLNKFLGKQEN